MRNFNKSALLLLGSVVSMLATAGCGAQSSATATAVDNTAKSITLNGCVRFNGLPITGGFISFRAKAGGPSHIARINRGGNYTVTTSTGTNYVTVECPEFENPKYKGLANEEQTFMIHPELTTLDVKYPVEK